jgi:DNA-binding NarL/FixJ family response regulator
MVRVLVADDQEPFLQAAGAVIAATPGFELVGVARDGREAVALAAELAPDVVVLDVRMPGLDGPAAATRIRRRRPETIALLVSAHRRDDLADLGGAWFVRKEAFGPAVLRRVCDA